MTATTDPHEAQPCDLFAYGPFPKSDAAANAMMMMTVAMYTSRLIQTAAELGLPDALTPGSTATTEELAAATSTHNGTLYRVLRALALGGVFVEVERGRWAHTELSAVLRADHPGTVRHLALMCGAQWHWRTWAALTEAVRTGRSPFEATHGSLLWEYLDQHPAEQFTLQQGMTDFSTRIDGLLAEALDVGEARTVVDVAGGHGSLLTAVLRRHPQLDGVLFESGRVLQSLAADPRAASAPPFRHVAGNALDRVDCPADIYMMRHFIHLFEDDVAVQVLANCVRSAPVDARVVVMERVIEDSPKSVFGKLLDLQTFAVSQGGERTEDEFRTLFDRAGLTWKGVTHTDCDVSLIEGVRTADPTASST